MLLYRIPTYKGSFLIDFFRSDILVSNTWKKLSYHSHKKPTDSELIKKLVKAGTHEE